MKGRELILYILENRLEDENVFSNGRFIGFMTVADAAEKYEVGTATVMAWLATGRLDGMVIDHEVYIPCNSKLKEVNHVV